MSTAAIWPMVPLEDLVRETQYGTSAKSNEMGRGQPVVGMKHLTYDGALDIRDVKSVELPKGDVSKLDLRRGDLLFNRTNSRELVGKTAVWNGPDGFTFAGYLIRVRLREDRVLPGWVSRFMNSPEGKTVLFHMAKPSINMANISASDLLRLAVPVAPLAHQHRTIDILDKADAVRRKRKEAIALTEELLQSAFLEMFGDPVTNPKGWPTVALGDVAHAPGSLVDGPFGSSLKPEHYTLEGVRVVRNYNINDDYFDDSQFKFVTRDKFEELRRSEVVPGDLLITTKGTVGDVCLMPALDGSFVLSASGTVRLRIPLDAGLLGEFMVSQMIQPTYKRYLRSFEAGSAQQYLNLSGIRKMQLIRPDPALQRAFVERKLRIRASQKHFAAALGQADALFDTLVQWAFRGELGRS